MCIRDRSSDVMVAEYSLSKAYPNPFNPSTSLSYTMKVDGVVNVSVYDVSGRMVSELENGFQSAGTHSVVFDASDLSSGIYFVNMSADAFTATQKIMLVK